MKHWNALSYDINSFMQYSTAMAMLASLPLQGNETILDIGCGTGKITFQIAQKVKNGHVTGVDLSQEMIEYASANRADTNIRYVCGDVVKMRYKNRFDAVVSFWTLSWVELLEKALRNIVASLKENGKMLLMYPLKHDVYETLAIVTKLPQWITYFENFSRPRPFFTAENVAGFLKKLPVTANIVSEEFVVEFSDKSEMRNSIRSWLPHLTLLPDDETKEQFLEDVACEYLTSHNLSENNPSMHFSILNIRGKRLSFMAQLSQKLSNSFIKISPPIITTLRAITPPPPLLARL